MRRLLNAGADKVSINTAAVINPQLVADASARYRLAVHRGGDRCQAGVGCGRAAALEVFTHGGRKATGLDAVDGRKRWQRLGAGEILLTSMDRDGTKIGFDLD